MSSPEGVNPKPVPAWCKPAIRIALFLVIVVFAFTTESCHNALLLHPSRTYSKTPADRKLNCEEVSFANPEGKNLSGWYFPAEGAIGAVVLNHGNADNIGLYLDYAEVITQAGVSLLLYDYQGFGKSERGTSVRGLVGDGLAAYDYLESRGAAPGGIVVMGVSLGTPVSCAVAAQRPHVKAVILEGAFLPQEEIYHHMGTLGWPFAFIISRTMPKIRPEADARTFAGRPLLMIHGNQDATTPISGAGRLFEAAGEPKWMWTIYGRGHFPDLIFHKRAEYARVLTAFLRHVFLKEPFVQPSVSWNAEPRGSEWEVTARVNGEQNLSKDASLVVIFDDNGTTWSPVKIKAGEQQLTTRCSMGRPVSVSAFVEPGGDASAGDGK